MKKTFNLFLFFLLLFAGKTFYSQSGKTCDSSIFVPFPPVSVTSHGDGFVPGIMIGSNNLWFSFVADVPNKEIIIRNTTDTSFFQAEVTVVYTGTCDSLINVGSDSISCVTDTTLGLVYNNLVVGQTYYIEIIRGSSTSNCRTCQQNGNNTAMFDLIIRTTGSFIFPNGSCATSTTCNMINNGGFENGYGCGEIDVSSHPLVR